MLEIDLLTQALIDIDAGKWTIDKEQERKPRI